MTVDSCQRVQIRSAIADRVEVDRAEDLEVACPSHSPNAYRTSHRGCWPCLFLCGSSALARAAGSCGISGHPNVSESAARDWKLRASRPRESAVHTPIETRGGRDDRRFRACGRRDLRAHEVVVVPGCEGDVDPWRLRCFRQPANGASRLIVDGSASRSVGRSGSIVRDPRPRRRNSWVSRRNG
jgi:hypothetical protein